MRARRWFGWAAAAALAACGGQTSRDGGDGGSGNAGSSGASASVSGTVGGGSVAGVDVAGIAFVHTESGASVGYAGVVITNQSGTCSALQRNANPANTTALSLLVATRGSSVPEGTYPLGPGGTSGVVTSATYVAQDSACRKTTDEQSQTGTITLSTITASLVTGSFDVTFPGGDHLTGTFSAPLCAVDLATLANQPALPCGQ